MVIVGLALACSWGWLTQLLWVFSPDLARDGVAILIGEFRPDVCFPFNEADGFRLNILLHLLWCAFGGLPEFETELVALRCVVLILHFQVVVIYILDCELTMGTILRVEIAISILHSEQIRRGFSSVC